MLADPIWRPAIRPVRILAILALIALLLTAAMPPLLTAYARWLMAADPPRSADVAVVLAGGEGERLLAAMRIYREGRAGAILIVGPDVPLLPVYTGEDSLTQGEVKRRIAIRRGIPDEDVWLALGATSTYEEARHARAELERRGAKSAIVVTSPMHLRRSRATFRKIFEGSGIEVGVESLPADIATERADRWWTRERELVAVFTETVKGALYWRKYGADPF